MQFFRKIRHSQIKGGKLKSYILYAIGEVLLVMIGISLAFQVNNWSNERINRTTEVRYYENIRAQIASDKELILGQLRYNQRFMIQFRYANEIIEANDRTKLDTLGVIIRNLTQYSDFDKEGNIYETMVNSGEVKLLQNFDIVDEIRELEVRYFYVNRMESIHYDAMMGHVVAVINPLIKYSTNEIILQDDVFNYKFQNILIILMQIMEEKDQTYNKAISSIDYITDLINKELLAK
jgi:hypothetical protein